MFGNIATLVQAHRTLNNLTEAAHVLSYSESTGNSKFQAVPCSPHLLMPGEVLISEVRHVLGLPQEFSQSLPSHCQCRLNNGSQQYRPLPQEDGGAHLIACMKIRKAAHDTVVHEFAECAKAAGLLPVVNPPGHGWAVNPI